MHLLVRETHKLAKYILDAKHEGNVARFINHSCDPNLYVQPVLSHHHDIAQTQVCLFAGHNIAPMTELTYASPLSSSTVASSSSGSDSLASASSCQNTVAVAIEHRCAASTNLCGYLP